MIVLKLKPALSVVAKLIFKKKKTLKNNLIKYNDMLKVTVSKNYGITLAIYF